jgi:hypothetical protein
MSRPFFEAFFGENFCENCTFGGDAEDKENYCHHVDYQIGKGKKVPCSANTCPLLRDLVLKANYPLTKPQT